MREAIMLCDKRDKFYSRNDACIPLPLLMLPYRAVIGNCNFNLVSVEMNDRQTASV